MCVCTYPCVNKNTIQSYINNLVVKNGCVGYYTI